MPRFRSATIRRGFDIGAAAGVLADARGTFTTNSLPLRSLIGFAYDLQDPQISGPEALDSERYSITAHPEEVPAVPGDIVAFRLMVRELLAERFDLQFHWETRPSRALALVRCAEAGGLKRAAESDPGPVLRLRDASSINVGNAALEPLFTSWLSTRLGMPVVDRTGLSGSYSFDLSWDGDAAEDGPSREALKNALEAQLGLTLEATETEIERLVVDRVEQPTDLEPEPVEVEVDPETLERYVGRYALARGSIVSVSRDEGKLVSRLAGQGPVHVFPASATEFFAKVVPARITFVVDDHGRATGLVLHQGGREIHARRVDDADA